MAINYLNSIDLNQNELIHGTIENQASDALAGTPVEGQLYFNTTAQILKVGREILPATNPKTYEWVEVGGGVETLSTTQTGDSTGNALTVLSNATGDVTINSFAYAGGSNIGYVPTGGTASNFLKGDGTWAALDNYGNWKLSANGAATININSGNTVDFVGTGTTTVSRSSKTITINSADQYVGTVTSVSQTHGGNAFTVGGSPITSSGTLAITMAGTSSQYIDGAGDLTTFPSIPSSFTVTLTGDVTGSGATGTNIATTISAGAVDFAMINAAAIVTEAEGIENNDNDTTIPTSAAVKAYADSLIVGGLIYQGGYNAATNTPDLDSSPSSAIKKGWTYTVTADGLFFTEQVRVGDVIIAESDAPTALADWTTVQNNIDLADGATIGIGNVAASTDVELLGINVAYDNPTSGTAHVGLDIDGLPSNTLPSQAGDVSIPFVDDTSGTNAKATLDDLIALGNSQTSNDGEITAGSLSGTVTHNWGTEKVIVQTYKDNATDNYPTVFCDITRTSNAVTATIASTETDDIIILVQKIG